MKIRPLFGAVLAAASFWGAAAFPSELPVAQAIEAARGADVVFVGETHDNPAHHVAQAEFAAALQPRAIVFEMIFEADEAMLADLRAKGAPRDDLAGALNWAENGWPEFAQYAPIIEAAPMAAILGAQTPRAALRAAITDGAAAAFGAGAGAVGLDHPLPGPEQQARETRQAAAHCDALPPEMLPGMVEAQRLRDALLAAAVLRARTLPGNGPVLVITGNGHADTRRGVPSLLALADPGLRLFSFGQLEATPDTTPPHDAWRVTAPAPREDPCAAFRAD